MRRSGRLGKPAGLAGITALLSDEPEWINGQVWCIGGGSTSTTEYQM